MSPPGLHITLGVFYRLWTLLEQACHQLDLELAKRKAPLSTDRESFTKYAEVLRELASLEDEKNELGSYAIHLHSQTIQIGSQIPNPNNNHLLTALQQEVNRATTRLQELVRPIL